MNFDTLYARFLECPAKQVLSREMAKEQLPLLCRLERAIDADVASLQRPRPACPVATIDTGLLRPLIGSQLGKVREHGHHASTKSLVVFLPDALAQHAATLAWCQPWIQDDSPLDYSVGEVCFHFAPRQFRGAGGIDVRMPIPTLGADVWNMTAELAWVPVFWVARDQVALGGFCIEAGARSAVESVAQDALRYSSPPFLEEWRIEEAAASLGSSSPTPWFDAPYLAQSATMVVGTTEFTYDKCELQVDVPCCDEASSS